MRFRLLSATAAVGLAATAGGIAYASIPDSGGTIHGCYVTKDGTLRVIDPSANQSCDPKRENALNWNAQGPQGPAGPTGPQGPAGTTHGYEANAISEKNPGNLQDTRVVKISGLPDGNYLFWAQVNVFGTPGDIVYCYVEGTNRTGYTVEEQISSPFGSANPVIVGAATLTGGSSTVDIDCESGLQTDTYAALSLTPVDALN